MAQATLPQSKSSQTCSLPTGLTSASENVGETERWLSLAAGGALAFMGLRQGPVRGLLSLGFAAGLIYRGLSGHCQMYDALGIDTSDHG